MKSTWSLLSLVALLSLADGAAAQEESRVYLRLTRLAEAGQAADVSIPLVTKADYEVRRGWQPRYGEPLAVVMTPFVTETQVIVGLWFDKNAAAFATTSPPEKLYYVALDWDKPAAFEFGGSKFVLSVSLQPWPSASGASTAQR